MFSLLYFCNSFRHKSLRVLLALVFPAQGAGCCPLPVGDAAGGHTLGLLLSSSSSHSCLWGLFTSNLKAVLRKHRRLRSPQGSVVAGLRSSCPREVSVILIASCHCLIPHLLFTCGMERFFAYLGKMIFQKALLFLAFCGEILHCCFTVSAEKFSCTHVFCLRVDASWLHLCIVLLNSS